MQGRSTEDRERSSRGMLLRGICLLCLGALALAMVACSKDTATSKSGVSEPTSGVDKPARPGSAVKKLAKGVGRAPFRAHFGEARVVRFAKVAGKWTASWQTPPKAGVLDLATVCAKDLFFDGAVKPLAPVGLFHNPKLQRQELVFEVMSNSYETGRGEKRKAIIYMTKDGLLRCRHADNYAFKLQGRSCLKTRCARVKTGITPSK